MSPTLGFRVVMVEGHSRFAGERQLNWQDGAVSGKLGVLREHPLAGSKETTPTCR
ncbi:unannotated protein [freshwater metagenome]|uniref:Unannotated protein n=1 Tax=freshwater metagenome TaxID=449393 RepID=A0A6J7K6G3_9ZZZZ